MKEKTRIMTEGSPLSILTAFTLPSLAGNLLNQVYSITDSIIVGRFLGQTSLAAIGVCMPIVLLVSSIVIGLNVGVGILMSQNYGAGNISKMRHTLANALYMAVAIALFVLAIGYPLTVPILKLLNTPAGPMAEAATYIHITLCVVTLPLLYFLINNTFRGLGDSVTPLYSLIVSVVLNVFLDYIFIGTFGWGVAGSAWATALAELVSVVFAIMMLYRKYPFMRLEKADFTFDWPLIKQISLLAIPIGLQSSFNCLGNVVVQGCINGFGEAVMAAYTAASRIGTLALMPAETLGNSLSVYAGQNYGAKKIDRIKSGVRAAWIINIVIATTLGILLLTFGKSMTYMFLEHPTEEIIHVSYRFILIAAVPSILNGMMCIYQQVLRGVGKATESVVGGFMQLGVKVLVAVIGASVVMNLDTVWLAWPLSFIGGTIFPFIIYRRWITSNIIVNNDNN